MGIAQDRALRKCCTEPHLPGQSEIRQVRPAVVHVVSVLPVSHIGKQRQLAQSEGRGQVTTEHHALIRKIGIPVKAPGGTDAAEGHPPGARQLAACELSS